MIGCLQLWPCCSFKFCLVFFRVVVKDTDFISPFYPLGHECTKDYGCDLRCNSHQSTKEMVPVTIVTVPNVQGVWGWGLSNTFSAPDRCFVLSWAQRHKSITSLSTGHLCISHLPQAPSIHYTDGHVSGDEEKSSDLQQSFAALHLGSWTGSCKKKDRQLLSSLGEGRPHPTDQLLSSLNWQSGLFFLKEAVVCVCSVWKRSLFVQFSFEQTGCLV